MLSSLKKELLYGSRAVLRDNIWNRRLLARLRSHETFTAEALLALQQKLLHASMQKALVALPYYQHISADFGISEAACVLREAFPLMDKQTLLANPRTLYPHAGKRRPWEAIGKTSGTTGTPLSIWRSPISVAMENAFIKRHWSWSGFHDGMRRATLRGDMVVPLEQATAPYWFYNRYNQQLLLSSRHLVERCADPMIDMLERFAPAMLQAYPSTAYTLAQLLERRGRTLRIPFLFSASEPLYPHQRKLIMERLGCQVMDMYGMAERVAFATQCEYGEMHINPDYSFVEIIDEHGLPTTGYGRVVGTTLHNLAMPLMRYQLSDQSRWKPGSCRCGRHFPMIEAVTGKLEDSLTGSGGAVVSPSVLTFAFKGVSNIEKSQVAQVGREQWQIRLVPGAGFSEEDGRKLIDNVRTLVDPGVQVDIVLRESLPNTEAGKFRWVVNEWK